MEGLHSRLGCSEGASSGSFVELSRQARTSCPSVPAFPAAFVSGLGRRCLAIRGSEDGNNKQLHTAHLALAYMFTAVSRN